MGTKGSAPQNGPEQTQLEQAAATRIQSIERGRLARKETKKQKQKDSAAKQEQNRAIGISAEALALETAAATRIQSVNRGRVARKDSKKQKKKDAAAKQENRAIGISGVDANLHLQKQKALL